MVHSMQNARTDIDRKPFMELFELGWLGFGLRLLYCHLLTGNSFRVAACKISGLKKPPCLLACSLIVKQFQNLQNAVPSYLPFWSNHLNYLLLMLSS